MPAYMHIVFMLPSGFRVAYPVRASQSCAGLSSLPVRTRFPSGLNATALTCPWWRSSSPSGVPVRMSQSRKAVFSKLPDQRHGQLLRD